MNEDIQAIGQAQWEETQDYYRGEELSSIQYEYEEDRKRRLDN